MEWINKNKDWLFSGIGIVFFTALYQTYLYFSKNDFNTWFNKNNETIYVITIGILLIVILVISFRKRKNQKTKNELPVKKEEILDHKKERSEINILFIDDKDFKVVDILKTAGWVNTTLVKDISSLYSEEVIKTNIFFIDIDGVGKQLNFKDEGLGLALALKKKYPNKFIVIYSSIKDGDRLHPALNKVDATLDKDAEPFEFTEMVEEFMTS